MSSTNIPVLSEIVRQNGKVDLFNTKRIYPLPKDLVFVVDTTDVFESFFDLSNGLGHEPYMIDKILHFVQSGDVYVEVGANYGDFSLQVSSKLGSKGKVYAFEPGQNLFECFSISIVLNNIKNIVLENLAVLDKPQKVNFFEDVKGSLGSKITNTNELSNQVVSAITLDNYFQGSESSINVIRLDAEGSECKILKGAKNIIDSSPNIKIFVEWQAPLLKQHESIIGMEECLSGLKSKGFIFLDILGYNKNCPYQNYQLSVQDILRMDMIEFLAVRENTIKNLVKPFMIGDIEQNCSHKILFLLYDATFRNSIIEVKNVLEKGGDVNYFYPSGCTALYLAAQEKFFEIAKILLEAGANTEIKSKHGYSPLYASVENNDLSITKLLLDYGASTEFALSSGSTPLFYTAYFGNDEMAQLLLSYGAKRDVQVNGISAFMVALQKEHPSTAKIIAGGDEQFCTQISGTVYDGKYIGMCEEVYPDL